MEQKRKSFHMFARFLGHKRMPAEYFLIITMTVFCLMTFCFGSPVYAKSGKEAVTQGTEEYRGFQVDNVYHSPGNGDIHYHSYFPDSYDGKKKMALYVTLPGYQGLYFQGVAENLKTEGFAFKAKKYNKDMIILAPQLEDWEETSANQTIALVEYFLDNYPVNPARVYINGYSGGGFLFCRDKEIMGWLFAQEKTAAKKTKYSITLNKTVYTIKKGKSVKLKAALNKSARKKGVEWKSSNPKIASVSKNGKVTAKKNGKTTITARIKGTNVKVESRITVGTPVSKIKLNKKSVSLKTGQKFTLKTTVSPKKASNKKAAYESSNSKVATVSKKGIIRAVSAGTAKIRVTAADGSGKKASCIVEVTESEVPVTSVTLNKSQLHLKRGGEERLIATVNPSNATNKAVRWSSSNQAVVRVSDNGTVKAVAEGTATITASAENDIRAVCTVTVEAVSEQPEEPEKPVDPEKPEEPESGKILVAYFSWSGTSERIANNIIEQTGADSFRIERETPYSDNYNEVTYGEAKDEADNNARPPIKNPLASVDQYDRIVLCYPIWWHTAPMTVGTFLESYDLSGKHIYPVSQSASMDATQYAQSIEFIKACALGAVVDDGIFSKDNTIISAYITDTVMQSNPSSASNITTYADVTLLTLNNGVQIP